MTLLNETSSKPDCEACGKIDVIRSNFWIITVVDLYSSVIIKDGSIDIDAIQTVLELEDIHPEHKKDITLKIMTYINTYLSSCKDNKLTKIR
jgi:hypothetical protein